MRGSDEQLGFFDRIKKKKMERTRAMKEIAQLLVADGYEVCATQVDNRWKSLLSRFRVVEDHNNTSGNDTMAGGDYHEDMAEILGERASTKPKVVAGSGVPLEESLAPVLSSLRHGKVAQDTDGAANDDDDDGVRTHNAHRRASNNLSFVPSGSGSASSSVCSSPGGRSRSSSPGTTRTGNEKNQPLSSLSGPATSSPGTVSAKLCGKRARQPTPMSVDDDADLLDELEWTEEDVPLKTTQIQGSQVAHKRQQPAEARNPTPRKRKSTGRTSEILQWAGDYQRAQAEEEAKRREFSERHHQEKLAMLDRLIGALESRK